MDGACGNCGEILRGAYCHGCGQKRLADGDRRLGHLLRQAFGVLSDLDGPLWGSLRALFFQPGRLSRDYLDGRRRRWMSPVGLFLLANVLYFLSPGTLSDFNLSLQNQLMQPHSAVTRPWLVQRLAERDAAAKARWERLPEARRSKQPPDYTLAEYAVAYDAQSGNVGKALIVVHIPVLALGLMLAFRRRGLYFAEHVVVATHQFTFLLLYIQLVMLPLGWIAMQAGYAATGMPLWAKLGMLGIVWTYLSLSLRRVYQAHWAYALALPLALNLLLLAANLWVYRFLQFAITFALS